jgi:glycosyltransferase involved in cell wall biosynthesis
MLTATPHDKITPENVVANVALDSNSPTAGLRTLIIAPSLQKPGGIERYTRTLQLALEDLIGGGNVRLLVSSRPTVGGAGKLALPLLAKMKIASQALWQALSWRPDLVICTHLSFGPFGWMARALTGRRYWVVLHGIEAWSRLPLAKRMAVFHADRVIVTSLFSQEQIMTRHRIDPGRVSTLPCTLDETLLSIEPASNRLSVSLPEQQRVILTVARMKASEGYKGHDVVLRSLRSVVKQIPHVTYVVVGDGDDRSRLEQLTNDLGLAEYVIFTGSVSDSELVAWYRRSEIFVLPARTVIDDISSKGEGFGIVFLEAMAFGKPVIGPNYGAPTELIRNGENGLLVNPEDTHSIEDALLTLLGDPTAAQRMGRAGEITVRTSYSYPSFRERLFQLLS